MIVENKKREFENIANGNKGYKLLNNNEMENNTGNMSNKKNNYTYSEEEYDECIFFYHSFNFKRKFEYEENLKNIKEFPFLNNNEFIIGNTSCSSIEYDKNLSVLDNKKILQTVILRLKQFTCSLDNTFKLIFLDNLTQYAREIGFESTIDLIIPVLSKIVNDTYTVKIRFLSIFEDFLKFILSNGEKSYKIIQDLLHLIIELLVDKSEAELIDLACDDFILIAKELKHEEKGTLILSSIIEFANEEFEESRSLAVKLFGALAGTLGKDYCEQFIIPQLAFLADDAHFKVRKSVILNLSSIAHEVNFSVFSNKVLTIYKNLSKDLIWGIRKACVDILPSIMKLNKEKSAYTAKNDLFITLFTSFIFDSQKFVRASAIEIFGQFIYLLDKEELNDSFLNFYKNSIEEFYFNYKDFGVKSPEYNKIISHCAYNFPAVIYCYGATYWNKLKDVYANMANDEDVSVKISIISSFHEVSKVIGWQNVKNDLLTIYDSFLSHKNNEVRNHALSNMPNLMNLMSEEEKDKYLKYLIIYEVKEDSSFTQNRYDWRRKNEIMENYARYFNVFHTDVIWNKILPLCVLYCFDDVYTVRITSAKVISKILKFLLDNKNNYLNLKLENKISLLLETFAYSKIYHCRKIFIYLSKELLKDKKMFHRYLLESYSDLLFDKLIDVKISMAKMFSKLLNSNDPDFLILCKKLSVNDKKSVSEYFLTSNCIKLLQNIQIDEEEGIEDCSKLLFNNSIDYLKTEFKLSLAKFSSSQTRSNIDFSSSKFQTTEYALNDKNSINSLNDKLLFDRIISEVTELLKEEN